MDRRQLLAAMVVPIACSIASCGRSGKTKTLEIAFVTKALDSEWWQRVKAGAEEAAKSCLPVAIPSFEIIVARGLARRWPTRLRDREKYQVRRR